MSHQSDAPPPGDGDPLRTRSVAHETAARPGEQTRTYQHDPGSTLTRGSTEPGTDTTADGERPHGETASFRPGRPAGPDVTDGPTETDEPLSPAARRPPRFPGYEVLGVLGKGGMGVVYKARQVGLNRLVAVKVITAGPQASDAAVARFQAEAEAVARFQHPHLVQVFEVGHADGTPFFSLELVDGGTLAKKIGGQPQPPREAAAVVETLARAMQYAHERGVAHRDLKPSNVLLTADGTPKITDFGLAKSLEGDSGQTRDGQVLGTPSYMAPEQAAGRVDVGAPADVWALGAVLYDLLTGRPPFAGSSVLDTLEMVRTREPVPPGQLTARLPRDLEVICLKCLQKEIPRRYASAGELADDLRRFLDGRPIQARPVGSAERAWRWARRNPAGAAAVLLGLIAFVVPSILSVLLYVAEGQARAKEKEANEAKVFAQGEQARAEHERDLKEKARAAEEEAKGRADAERKVAQAEQARAEQERDLKEKARAAEQVAKERAEQERDLKEKARAAEQVAKEKADAERKRADEQRKVAEAQVNEALMAIREALRPIDDRMRGNLSLVPLRKEIVRLMLVRLDGVRKAAGDIKDPLDPRTEAMAHARMGGIYLQTGQVAIARDELTKALPILDAAAKQNPTDPAALLNLSSILNQLADTELRLGHADVALKNYDEALKVRQRRLPLFDELFKQKEVSQDNVTNAYYQVADSHGLVAGAALRLGDPARAIESYIASDEAFAELKTAGTLEVRQRRSEIQLRLGDARTFLNEFDAAAKHYEAAVKERETLLKLTPESAGFGMSLRTSIGQARMYHGDFLLTARRDVPAARAEYVEALRLFAAELTREPDLIELQRLVAAAHYRLGYLGERHPGAERALCPVAAASHYAECLRLRERLAKTDPSDLTAKVEWMLALARAGKSAEAEKLAGELNAIAELDQQVRFQVVCGFSVLAGAAKDEAVAERCRKKGFAALQDLVKGWKARGQLELDPDLDALRADPQFRAVVGK